MRHHIGCVTKKHFHFHKTSLLVFYSSMKEPFMFFVELWEKEYYYYVPLDSTLENTKSYFMATFANCLLKQITKYFYRK